jgi:hypothetical protein
MAVGAKELDLFFGGGGGDFVLLGAAVLFLLSLFALFLLGLGFGDGDAELGSAFRALGGLARAIVGTMDLMPVGARNSITMAHVRLPCPAYVGWDQAPVAAAGPPRAELVGRL